MTTHGRAGSRALKELVNVRATVEFFESWYGDVVVVQFAALQGELTAGCSFPPPLVDLQTPALTDDLSAGLRHLCLFETSISNGPLRSLRLPLSFHLSSLLVSSNGSRLQQTTT